MTDIIAKSAVVRFDNRGEAKLFARAWALATLRGHDMSSTREDGSVDVTVYDLTASNLEMLKKLCGE